MRAEQMIRLQEALNSLDPIDREVLSLRHFEQLTRQRDRGGAGYPGVGGEPNATSVRSRRLKEILAGMPGGLESI